MQQGSLKAAAAKVLSRNSACNSYATTAQNPCNKACNKRPHLLHGRETLDTALADACQQHGMDAEAIRAELVDAGDWPDLTPAALRTYVAAVARSRIPGTRAELLALIDRWANTARLDAHQRQELHDAAQALAPAFVGENVEYFRRRLAKAADSKQHTQATAPMVRCRDCRHWTPDAINPAAGLGACTARERFMRDEPPPYPNAPRRCRKFSRGERE